MATTPFPRNWQSFLHVDSNNEELFNFLADHIGRETPPDGKELLLIFATSVKCTGVDKNTTNLEPCTHEKADTRLMMHTVDTDVMVLAISH